jgi:hypothetical protein
VQFGALAHVVTTLPREAHRPAKPQKSHRDSASRHVGAIRLARTPPILASRQPP